MYRDANNISMGLSDKVVPPLEQDFWQQTLFFWGVIANSYYERTIAHLVTALNWNDGIWNWVSGSIDWREVASIVNTYGNLVVKKEIPIYDLSKLTKEQQSNVVDKVSQGSGFNPKLTKRVLDQLYYYTKDGTIKFDGILRPSNNSLYLKNNSIPDEYKNSSKSQDPDSNLFSAIGLPTWTGKAIVITAFVGLGVYALTQINTSAKILKG
jgi:hypothetical protein